MGVMNITFMRADSPELDIREEPVHVDVAVCPELLGEFLGELGVERGVKVAECIGKRQLRKDGKCIHMIKFIEL